jgi:hypothetical protein
LIRERLSVSPSTYAFDERLRFAPIFLDRPLALLLNPRPRLWMSLFTYGMAATSTIVYASGSISAATRRSSLASWRGWVVATVWK